MITVTASIVIYHEKKEILQRVIENFLALDVQKTLYIVDNSPQNHLQSFCEQYNHVSYLFSGTNLGFGVGHNLAFKYLKTSSDIHMIINPDIYFDSQEITQFLHWFTAANDVSLAIPKVYYKDGTFQPIVRNIPTIMTLIKRKMGVTQDEWSEESLAHTQEIPFAHGCFYTFKTEVFKQLHGFDERFFLYMEDLDIFIRAKAHGNTVINPNFKIYHEHRKGSSKSFKLFFLHLSSAIKFFLKYNFR